MVVHPSVPARTLHELTGIARQQPKKLSYGSGGIGSTNHLAMEAFKSAAGIDVLHVPYKGATVALVDAISGQVDIVVVAVSSVAQYVQQGKLRGIASLSPRRSSAMPALPTTAEGFDLVPSTPQELAALMKSEHVRFGKIVKDAGIQPE